MTERRVSKRQRQEAKLHEEGESLRSQYRQLTKQLCIDLETDEDGLRRLFYHKPEDDWIAAKLNERRMAFDELPGGTYQEPDKPKIDHQQKYYEYLRKTSPSIFQELRSLEPSFLTVFGKPASNEEIIDIVKKVEGFMGLFWDQSTNPTEGFPLTPSICSIPSYFSWKRYKVPLLVTRLISSIENNESEEPTHMSTDVGKWYQELIAGPLYGYDLDRAKTASKRIFSTIQKFFGVSPTDTLTSTAFLSLQCGLFDWMERHHFERDFMLVNAYILIGQFTQNPEQAPDDALAFGRIIPRRLQAEEFTFRTDGWWAYKESPGAYLERTIDECKKQLSEYLINSHNYLNLAKMTHITKPKDPDFESIFWLIAWNEGATYPQIARCFNRSRYTIKDGTNNLKAFDLPKRIGRQGRMKIVVVTTERLTQIRQHFRDAKSTESRNGGGT